MEVFRSFPSQLFCHLRDHGIDPGDLREKIFEGKSEGTLSLDDPDKLRDLLSCAASCFRREPVIVIDALDECIDIEAFLGVLVTLNQADIWLLVTSQPCPIIMSHLTGLPLLSFESVIKELAVDMALHVRQEVNLHNWLRSTDLEMENEMHARLNEKVEGR